MIATIDASAGAEDEVAQIVAPRGRATLSDRKTSDVFIVQRELTHRGHA